MYPASILAGFFFGGFQSLAPPLIAERFGSRSYAALNAASQMATAIGGFLLNAELAASVYNSHVQPKNGSTCIGPECFRLTFWLLTALCMLGAVSTVALWYRLRPLYDNFGKPLPYAEGAARLAAARLPA